MLVFYRDIPQAILYLCKYKRSFLALLPSFFIKTYLKLFYPMFLNPNMNDSSRLNYYSIENYVQTPDTLLFLQVFRTLLIDPIEIKNQSFEIILWLPGPDELLDTPVCIFNTNDVS